MKIHLTKVNTKWFGLYEIQEKTSDKRYYVPIPGYSGQHHFNIRQLKKWVERDGENWIPQTGQNNGEEEEKTV